MRFYVDVDPDLIKHIRQFPNEVDPGTYKQIEIQDSVVLEDGTFIKPIATFKTENNCVAHIYIDNNRYVIGHEWIMSLGSIRGVTPMTHSFPELIEAMEKLPDIVTTAQEKNPDT